MAELGYVALVLALAACVFSIAVFIIGLRSSRQWWLGVARKGVLAATVLFSISVIALVVALIGHDFQIEYVYSYTSSDLSLPYLISALWAGNAGSLFFWGWLLSLATAVVVLKKQSQAEELKPYAALVILVILVFFILLLLFAQNPFHELPTAPAEGIGL